MRKLYCTIILCAISIVAFSQNDIYRTVLMNLYQMELEYSYTNIPKSIERALSNKKDYQDFVIVEDYSKKPIAIEKSKKHKYDIIPYKQYFDSLCEFDDNTGVYVAFARYSNSDRGINIIKDGDDVWYFCRNLRGQHMQSVVKLWNFCRKYKYNNEVMLYMMRAFIMSSGDRNICPFQESTYDIDQLYGMIEINNEKECNYVDLFDGIEKPFCSLQKSGVCFAKYKHNYDDSYLIYYDGDMLHYSPNILRYRFGFLRKAFILLSQGTITEKQLMKLIEILISEKY